MRDLALHLVLFVFSGGVVVTIGVLFGEPEDGPAWRALPRRLASFFLGCALVIAAMTIFEHTFAAIR